MHRAFSFWASLALAIAASGSPLAGEPPAGPQDPAAVKAAWARLVSTYQASEKKHDPAAVRTRRMILEEMGDLKYPPSVAFFDQVIAREREASLLVAALAGLGKVGSVQAVQAAFGQAMRGRDEFIKDALPWGMRHCRDEKAAEWVAVKCLPSADPALRLAAAQSLGAMGCRSATEGLLKRLKDKDVAVLYESVRALGFIGDERAAGALRELCGSADWRIREAAASGLGSFRDDESFSALARLLGDQAWQARESAVSSLRRMGRKDATLPLIEAMRTSTRRVAVGIQETLVEWTGKDFGLDPDLWKSWWASKGREEAGQPATPELTLATYHGIAIASDKAIFVIDTSGSMEWGDRISKAKEELSKALRALDSRTMFNIVTFAGSSISFRKEMVAAGKDTVAQADEWLMKQRPFGGTNTYDALVRAVSEPGVDSVYFLSDGIPTDGSIVEQERILAEIDKLNRFLKVRVHTIAFLVGDGPAEAEEDKPAAERFMRLLAEENQGKAVCKG